jgi:hypothetical protein
MSTQNVTLCLSKEVVRRVKIAAAKRGTSISRMLTEAIERILSGDEGYERARRRHLALLKRPVDLGTGGRATWSREDLHER